MDQEIKLTSAAKGLEIKLASAAKCVPEIELTSAAESPENEVVSVLKPTPKSSGCIFRAPAHIRYGRESDFEPKLVSIGLYYHGRENLKHMEVSKLRCMSDLLKLRSVGGSNIDRVPVDPFMRFERGARCFYKEKFNHSDDEFVQMLVLDSCFIIRIMFSLSPEVQESMAFLDVNIKEVRSDLLLLENQIPLFFIEEVYKWFFLIENEYKIFPDYETVLESFICLDFPRSWKTRDCGVASKSYHLLELYWKSLAPIEVQRQIIEMEDPQDVRQEQPSWAQFNLSLPKSIANATELHQMAGIKFENNLYNHNDGFCVVFSKGIMYMPCLKINSSNMILFVNLIAFENSILPSFRIFSTYVKIMDDLIDSEKDVELLQKSGVIYNTLSSHTKAATFFNDIGNFCSITYCPNPSSDLFFVRKYYHSSWNRRWASLQNNYFNSPWAGISVFAGVILLILTVLQTFYTIYPYYNPRN